ncbi:hypothetical protein I4F81_010015 [Pyropia yezoensis]|uniref:Uncharacterized protein n=1 Tax=Pyropia yezoensis TaxID=2788 RepID=A0ACC3CCD7_PYRYE|nr:hypothetical protein I4F81_010015 [Neopyropia yezoensis]
MAPAVAGSSPPPGGGTEPPLSAAAAAHVAALIADNAAASRLLFDPPGGGGAAPSRSKRRREAEALSALPPPDEHAARLRAAVRFAAGTFGAPPGVRPARRRGGTGTGDGGDADGDGGSGVFSVARLQAPPQTLALMAPGAPSSVAAAGVAAAGAASGAVVTTGSAAAAPSVDADAELRRRMNAQNRAIARTVRSGGTPAEGLSTALALAADRPVWRPPWRVYRVLAGHLGWVRALAVEPGNEWFVSGSADRTIKVWDTASGRLKLTLTGHIGVVRGLAVSARHPYMFSAGDDKQVKCWDLETNQVVRHYHGHLSGVYTLGLHPTLDVLVTGGRDSTVRVWDMRTKAQVHALGSHTDVVNSVAVAADDPQIMSGSADGTVRLWDLAAGRCYATLTHHKKGVRAVVRHPRRRAAATASADAIKTWSLPRGGFARNLRVEEPGRPPNDGVLINALAANEDGLLVSGGDAGGVTFWDWDAAAAFQAVQTVAQPGSLAVEAGVFATAFDVSGSRLLTGEADKTIKMWKEVEGATETDYPLNWAPDLNPKRY